MSSASMTQAISAFMTNLAQKQESLDVHTSDQTYLNSETAAKNTELRAAIERRKAITDKDSDAYKNASEDIDKIRSQLESLNSMSTQTTTYLQSTMQAISQESNLIANAVKTSFDASNAAVQKM